MSSFLSDAWPWVLVVIGFMVLIMAHELGHFFAAKKTGMRVEQLSLFFGPKIFRVQRGETEYCIGTIPAGGYAKITGMNPEEELPPEVAPRAYYHQPVWKRIVVIAAGPAVNIVLAFVILFGLAFGVQRATELLVGKAEPNTPAARYLQKGDRIVAVDDVKVAGTDINRQAQRISDQVNSHKCAGGPTPDCRASTPVRFVVERNGSRVVLHPRPFYDAKVKRYRLGFQIRGGGLVAVNPSAPEAAGRAVSFMWLVTSKTVGVIARIFEPEQRKQVSGIVGTSDVAQKTVGLGARRALVLFAVVSLSLGLINLFPFLPLDGGHIFWSLVEKVRGSPVPFRVMEQAGVIGFVLVIALFVIGFTNDIGRLTGQGFNVR